MCICGDVFVHIYVCMDPCACMWPVLGTSDAPQVAYDDERVQLECVGGTGRKRLFSGLLQKVVRRRVSGVWGTGLQDERWADAAMRDVLSAKPFCRTRGNTTEHGAAGKVPVLSQLMPVTSRPDGNVHDSRIGATIRLHTFFVVLWEFDKRSWGWLLLFFHVTNFFFFACFILIQEALGPDCREQTGFDEKQN